MIVLIQKDIILYFKLCCNWFETRQWDNIYTGVIIWVIETKGPHRQLEINFEHMPIDNSSNHSIVII